jgi:pilus assembly protein CpaF
VSLFGKRSNGVIGDSLRQTKPAFGTGNLPAFLLDGRTPVIRTDSEVPAEDVLPKSALELFAKPAPEPEPTPPPASTGPVFDVALVRIKDQVLPRILERIDTKAAAQLGRNELIEEFRPVTQEVLAELKIMLNRREQLALDKLIIDELFGYGPLEPLLANPAVTDIMVNGPQMVFIEIAGRLQKSDVHFRDDDHVLQIAQRMCNRVGRRVDQTRPYADARLEDGSRINVIIPPLSLKGPAISIRKFSRNPLNFEKMVNSDSMSAQMASVLKIAAACRANIVISGGTGSGKTTLLNAMSALIDPDERIVTIEDAAELQLQQPHVLPLETRPPNIEGEGQVTIRDLLINALRMRPDRIILGEVRGPEALDMLQAMNTGHDGSMCTLHANRPREAITRLENMVLMSGVAQPARSIRQQIVEAVDIIVQVSRMRDGKRRVTSITEVVGMEGDVVVTQDLFRFDYREEDHAGVIHGDFVHTGVRPYFAEKARQFNLEKLLVEACQ